MSDNDEVRVLRSLKLKHLLKLEVHELETLIRLFTSAFVHRCRQHTQDCDTTTAAVVEARRAELHYAPTVSEMFASQPVKLNVGGEYFSTSLDTLTKEPSTFFSVLFGDRWEPKINPDDKAVFIDRDPALFPVILSYLRTGTIEFSDLSVSQIRALAVEADFYQISSLLAQIPRPKFATQLRGTVHLSDSNTTATNQQAGMYSYAISQSPFSAAKMDMSAKILAGSQILIGVAPRSVLVKGNHWQNCGWYIFAVAGKLCGSDGTKIVDYSQPISVGSTVTVKMDKELNIRFVVDGEDWGVAYRKVAEDFTADPLFLCVEFNFIGKDLDVVPQGVVQLL